MATKGERVFAWVGIAVVVLSTAALSAAVIVEQIITSKSASDAASANASSSLSCVDNLTEPVLDLPVKFIVNTPVTSLQTTDLTKGSGTAAKAGDCLVVKYYGSLATNGTVFDQNFTSTKGFAFQLGEGQVIKGWDQGLVGMQPGGVRRLIIPAELAYGSQSTGSIPANAVLVFEVKLLRIQ